MTKGGAGDVYITNSTMTPTANTDVRAKSNGNKADTAVLKLTCNAYKYSASSLL